MNETDAGTFEKLPTFFPFQIEADVHKNNVSVHLMQTYAEYRAFVGRVIHREHQGQWQQHHCK